MAELETQTTFRETPTAGTRKDFTSTMRDVAGDAYMLLSLKSAPTSPSHGGKVPDFIVTSEGDKNDSNNNAMAKIEANGFQYMIRDKRTIIGRDSSIGKVDVNMGTSSFISRKHVEIYFEEPNNFFMICRGKNGVFVDGIFQRKGAPACKLSPSCQLRFPSTSIRLEFQSLIVDRNANIPNDTVDDLDKSLKNNDKSNTCKNIPQTHDGHELSPNASPTATISATNSCPSSPRTINRARFEATIGNNKNPDDLKKSLTYVASNLTKEPNIGQEAVDLIKPALPNPLDNTLPITPVQPKKKKPRGESGKSAYKPSPNTGEPSSIPVPFYIEPTDDSTKPPYSYAQLIVQAIASSPDRQLTLNDIYSWITKTYPFYRVADKGWQNSIRHNLSLNRYFIKVARCQSEPGKGSFWKIDETCMDKLTEQSFKKRRQRPNGATEQSPRFTTNHPREHQQNPNMSLDFTTETERAAASIGGQEVLESEIISADYNVGTPTAVGPSTYIVSNPFSTNQVTNTPAQAHLQTATTTPHLSGQTVKVLVSSSVDSSKIHLNTGTHARLPLAFANGAAFFVDPINLPPGTRIARFEQGTPGVAHSTITVPTSTISLASLPKVSENAPTLKAATVTVPANLPTTLPPGTVSIPVSRSGISVVVQDHSAAHSLSHQPEVSRIVIDSVGKVITLPIKAESIQQPQQTVTITSAVSSGSIQTISQPRPVTAQPTNPIDILTNVALMSDPNIKVETIKPSQQQPVPIQSSQTIKIITTSAVTLPSSKVEPKSESVNLTSATKRLSEDGQTNDNIGSETLPTSEKQLKTE